jgi:hypothetical protein
MEPGKCALEALAAVEAKPAISFTQRRHRCPWAKLTRRSRHCSESRSHIDCGNRKADRGAASNKKFMNLTQMASASVKIIFDTVSGSGWPPHARIRDHALPGQGQRRSHGTPEARADLQTGRSLLASHPGCWCACRPAARLPTSQKISVAHTAPGTTPVQGRRSRAGQ